ncbi:group II truncated hemoglobin [Bacteriovorax sp. DB6_IX]|uniref:group II truncated hemoglobin n=1 Tax=Bacteriovorax sp. DB6_IX TaxID=1353530 RepID=UPI0009DC1E95|nr:group II truncated hemoglobin [Bacteriovorax sp. DB6_IX]
MFKKLGQNISTGIKKVIKGATEEKSELTQDLPYDKIGGEKGIETLVTRFYHHMDTLDSAKQCRDLHGKSLDSAAQKLKMFLSGWLGGPSLYIQKYGHPRMRKRHFPFAIGTLERDQWLLCMREAMNDMKLEPEFDHYLWQAFRRFAEHMRNRD